MLTLVSAHACPSVCVCFSDVPSVHCNHPTLEHIPQGIPNTTTTMMLHSNNISVIEPGALSSFVSMSRLWINSNRLSTLQGVFEGLQEMTQIYAQDNDISALNEGDFSGLTKLREINLNNNRISTIAGRVFADLSSLQTLYLQDNEISVIGNDTFHGLFNLRNLYMSGNKLETITGGNTGQRTAKSMFIYSSGNKLTTVPREALANLSSLRSLVLSDNPIVYVGPRAFGPQLIEVKLQNTKLRVIDGAAFNNSPNVNRLTLSNNYLQYLPETVFQPLTYYGDYETLDLDGNPWVCDCQLAGYSAWLKAPQVRGKRFNSQIYRFDKNS
uniref:LRRCT domain-containing protein n=1 Tax=Branchiostoma floridae TaxID=7739 RepID=C3ZWC3_BRAFL|eukprot:XP_002587114.1 hypothetical protein BRAFLDRAFT_241921 [Branchiostoma floridae]